MKLPTKDEMRARFWELKTAIDAREEQLAAKHAELEPVQRQSDEIRQAIKAIHNDVIDGASMYDAKMEMAFLARGLGNVGSPA